jgi:PKD repeat protein
MVEKRTKNNIATLKLQQYKFMSKNIVILSMLVALLVGCKRIDVDFSYTPTTPRAGESIAFTNLSSAGEDWLWKFGDNSTSLAKNPYKIYKKPGTYIVTLMVDSARNQTCSKEITIYDTIPTFVCSTDTILHYQDVTFTANVYNPFNHTLTYEWIVSENCHIEGSNTNASLKAYFTSAQKNDSVTLLLTQNGKEYRITKHFTIHLTQAPAIVMQLADGSIVRQRMIKDRIEDYKPAVPEDQELINNTTDTSLVFNGQTFNASQLATWPNFANLNVQHIQIDAMAQKWYVTTPNGLYITDFDGSKQVLLDSTAIGAVYVDMERNRVYWASKNGLKGMSLIKDKYNNPKTQSIFNDLYNIQLITIDNANR